MTGDRRIPVVRGVLGDDPDAAIPPRASDWRIAGLNHTTDDAATLLIRREGASRPSRVSLPPGVHWFLPGALVVPGDELCIVLPGWRLRPELSEFGRHVGSLQFDSANFTALYMVHRVPKAGRAPATLELVARGMLSAHQSLEDRSRLLELPTAAYGRLGWLQRCPSGLPGRWQACSNSCYTTYEYGTVLPDNE